MVTGRVLDVGCSVTRVRGRERREDGKVCMWGAVSGVVDEGGERSLLVGIGCWVGSCYVRLLCSTDLVDEWFLELHIVSVIAS
jgi:hypothetical protein